MAKNFSARDAKRLTGKHNYLMNTLSEVVALDEILKDGVVKAADALAMQEALKILAEIPVDELKKSRMGIRTKTLADNGFLTIADVYGATPYKLALVKGISQENAYAIKRTVRDIAEKTCKEIKIKLSADNKTKESTALVTTISIYKNSRPYMREALLIKQAHKKRIDELLTDLKCSTNIFKWIFQSKKKKNKAIEAYDELTQLISSDYPASVKKVTSGIKEVSRTGESAAWDDFTGNSVNFYNILEKINPGVLGTDDAVYGLPEDLAYEIQNEQIYSDGLKCTLRRYQEWGVKYILHQRRVLLGDEMGLGKTIQAIAAMVSLRNTGATHFVVVCPASVLTNWCREIPKHSDLEAIKVHGSHRALALKEWKRTGGVAVTTYETTQHFKLEEDFKFSLLVVDEAHYIKNPQAQRTVYTQRLCRNAERLLFMTGTALENRVDEMILLIAMLQPDVADPIRDIAFMASAPQFRTKVAPVYYRRKREEVLTELPDLIESKEWCTMTRAERKKYEESVLSRNFAEARRVSWNVENLENSSKALRLKEIAEEAESEGRKLIVFTFFLDTIRKVTELLKGKCMPPISGAVSPQKRQEIIDKFDSAPPGSVLVAQIQSGGTGLNIQSASVVIFCEPQLKPSIENQAISRAYRMGQSRNVLVYRLLCENSIDERIAQILEEKQSVFDAFADKSASAQQSLEIDEKSFGNIISEEIERINSNREIA